MSKSALLLLRFKKLPFGLWLFSRFVCLKAPYFSSIHPIFTLLEPGKGEAVIKKRRAIQNHIGSIHAIAMANLCELVAGTTLEITLPSTHRWIPKSMKIDYLAKANSDVLAKTTIAINSFPESGSINVAVEVLDKAQTRVVTAEIEMYVSRRK